MNYLKKICQRIKEWNKPYHLPRVLRIPPNITFYIACLPLLGYIYEYFYYAHFGIMYNLYFSIDDCFRVLYNKGTLLFLIFLISLVSYSPIIFSFESIKDRQIKKIEIIVLISFFYVVFNTILFFVFSIQYNFSFFSLHLLGLIGFFTYIFVKRIFGFVLLLICVIAFFITLINVDIKDTEQRKLNFNIDLITGNNRIKILSEKDSCKYLIGKTKDYFFIMDNCDNLVKIYPSSDVKIMSFSKNHQN